jgi:hypothetical protein
MTADVVEIVGRAAASSPRPGSAIATACADLVVTSRIWTIRNRLFAFPKMAQPIKHLAQSSFNRTSCQPGWLVVTGRRSGGQRRSAARGCRRRRTAPAGIAPAGLASDALLPIGALRRFSASLPAAAARSPAPGRTAGRRVQGDSDHLPSGSASGRTPPGDGVQIDLRSISVRHQQRQELRIPASKLRSGPGLEALRSSTRRTARRKSPSGRSRRANPLRLEAEIGGASDAATDLPAPMSSSTRSACSR